MAEHYTKNNIRLKTKSVADIKKTGKARLIIAGSGGQGILSAGKILSYASIHQKMNVSCLPSYGAEMRGGYVYCTIVIYSADDIVSPISAETDLGVFMEGNSYRMLRGYLKKNALVILNSSLIKKTNSSEDNIEIEASRIAEQLGNIKTANMVATGAVGYIINHSFFPFTIQSLYYGIEQVFSSKNAIALSKKSLEAGWELMENAIKRNRKIK